MKIFVSWSGPLSRAVGELLHDWIPDVLPGAVPWISSANIDNGSIWFTEILQELQGSEVGVLCITRENKDRPWLLFEAGALSKGLTKSRVCPILIDLQSADLQPPLSQLNHTLPSRAGIESLLKTLNNQCPEPRPDERLKTAFDKFWPDFEKRFKDCLKTAPSKDQKPPSAESLLTQILENTRAHAHMLDKLVTEKNRISPENPRESRHEGEILEALFQKWEKSDRPAEDFYTPATNAGIALEAAVEFLRDRHFRKWSGG